MKSEFKKSYNQIEFYLSHIKYFVSPQQEDSATEYLVATTSMINGNSLIQGLMSDIQDPMAFWKKINKFNIGQNKSKKDPMAF